MKVFLLSLRQRLNACPYGISRRWFFPSLLWLYFLFTILFPLQAAVAYGMGQGGGPARALCSLVQDLAIIPLPLLSAPGGKMALQASEVPGEFSFTYLPDALALLLLSAATLVLVLLILLLCWLRLRDAGLSARWLLLGLVPVLSLKLLWLTPFCAVFAGLSLILYYLGLLLCSLTLVVFYCKAGQKRAQAEPPAPAPADSADAEPPMHLDRLGGILFLVLQFGFICWMSEAGAFGVGIPLGMLFYGGLYALLLLFHRKQESAREVTLRYRALVMLYAVFIPVQILNAVLISDAHGQNIAPEFGFAGFFANTLWLALALPWLSCRQLHRVTPTEVS